MRMQLDLLPGALDILGSDSPEQVLLRHLCSRPRLRSKGISEWALRGIGRIGWKGSRSSFLGLLGRLSGGHKASHAVQQVCLLGLKLLRRKDSRIAQFRELLQLIQRIRRLHLEPLFPP
jgi:hypothetical protein